MSKITNFFLVEDNNIYPSAEVLSIREFKELWERDKSSSKDKARKELAFIYHAYWVGALAAGIRDEDREQYAWNTVYKTAYKKPDDKIMVEAINRILKIQTECFPSYKLFQAAKRAFSNLTTFLENVDLEERDAKGRPIHTPKAIMDALTAVPRVADSLKQLEDKLEAEGVNKTTVASRPVNPLEI